MPNLKFIRPSLPDDSTQWSLGDRVLINWTPPTDSKNCPFDLRLVNVDDITIPDITILHSESYTTQFTQYTFVPGEVNITSPRFKLRWGCVDAVSDFASSPSFLLVKSSGQSSTTVVLPAAAAASTKPDQSRLTSTSSTSSTQLLLTSTVVAGAEATTAPAQVAQTTSSSTLPVKLGLGIGIPLLFLLVALYAFIVYRYRRHKRSKAQKGVLPRPNPSPSSSSYSTHPFNPEMSSIRRPPAGYSLSSWRSKSTDSTPPLSRNGISELSASASPRDKRHHVTKFSELDARSLYELPADLPPSPLTQFSPLSRHTSTAPPYPAEKLSRLDSRRTASRHNSSATRPPEPPLYQSAPTQMTPRRTSATTEYPPEKTDNQAVARYSWSATESVASSDGEEAAEREAKNEHKGLGTFYLD